MTLLPNTEQVIGPISTTSTRMNVQIDCILLAVVIGLKTLATRLLQFFSPEVAQWVVDNRSLVAIGSDACGIDAGNVLDYKLVVHTVRLFM